MPRVGKRGHSRVRPAALNFLCSFSIFWKDFSAPLSYVTGPWHVLEICKTIFQILEHYRVGLNIPKLIHLFFLHEYYTFNQLFQRNENF